MFDLSLWEINKLYPIYSYGILVINTRSHVITRIPYSFWGITNTYCIDIAIKLSISPSTRDI